MLDTGEEIEVDVGAQAEFTKALRELTGGKFDEEWKSFMERRRPPAGNTEITMQEIYTFIHSQRQSVEEHTQGKRPAAPLPYS
jgi:Ca2+-binding EF-hand superfamily protein